MAFANRGKRGEGLFKAACTRINRQGFIWYKFPDAFTGAKAPVPADYLLMEDGQVYLMEVKETEHEFRLKHGNVGADQIARMRNWQLAGAKAYVIVFHSTKATWRFIPVNELVEREGGSWNISIYSEYENPDEIIREVLQYGE